MAASEYHGLHRRPIEHFGDARDALYMNDQRRPWQIGRGSGLAAVDAAGALAAEGARRGGGLRCG